MVKMDFRAKEKWSEWQFHLRIRVFEIQDGEEENQ
jgi:hypothetical protein